METGLIVTIILAAFGSSGLWAFISMIAQHWINKYEQRHGARSASDEMLRGLGHDRIIYLCTKYIQKGSISPEEYEDLSKYLFEPYKALGGNGTAEKLMEEVNRLPVKPNK